MRELLGAQAEVDAEEAAALGEVEDDDKNAPVKEDRTCLACLVTAVVIDNQLQSRPKHMPG